MRCKKDDVAAVVARDSRVAMLDGRVVRCLSLIERNYCRYVPHSTRDWWLCEGNFTDFTHRACGPLEGPSRMELPDAWLRPLRDPGEDAKDETLQWKEVPTQQKEPA